MTLKESFSGWSKRNRVPILLALLTACMVAVIEMRHPFFFLQDDNLHQNLSYYVHNFRALLSGEVPLFNFHQYLGTPVLSCIQSAAFYLPNYVAVFLSRIFFNNYYGTMEFIALFHLILASLGFYNLMRHFGLVEWSCCFGAIAWTFCGFVMTTGNSWIQLVAYAAYLPWILLFSLRQIGRFNFCNFTNLIILRVLAIFVGNPSYFIYIFTFEILTVTAFYLVTMDKGATPKAVNAFWGRSDLSEFAIFIGKQTCSYLCVVLVAAPLLLPALHQVEISAFRKSPLTYEEYSIVSYHLIPWLNGIFTPLSDRYIIWPEQQFISHIGWLTLLFCITSFWRRGTDKKLVIVFLSLAAFSFFWANNTFITRLFYYIPLYNRQRYPFKLVFFTSFFLITMSSFGFDECFRRIKESENKFRRIGGVILPFVFLIHIGNFLAIYLVNLQRTFFCSRVQRPPLDEPLKDVLKYGRIISLISHGAPPDNCTIPGNARLLGYNFATLFELYHFAGYETLVSAVNLKASLMLTSDSYIFNGKLLDPLKQSLDYYRKWGVKWIVADKDFEIQSPSILKIAYSDDDRVVLYDAEAKPMVYWLDNTNGGGASHAFSINSIRVSTARESTGQLLVNVLYNPFFAANIDGKKTKITETADMQMLVNVPPGRHEIKITYVDPYFYNGLYISFGFLALVSGGWLLRRFSMGKITAKMI